MQMSHDEQSHRSWAPLIIVCIILIFGAFWYYQETHTVPEAPILESAPVTTVPHPDSPVDLGELQAATINTAIPDFSSEF